MDFRKDDCIKNMILERLEQSFCIDGIAMVWGRNWFDIDLPQENIGIAFNDGHKLMVALRDGKSKGVYCEDYLTREEVSDMFEYSTDGFLFSDRILELNERLSNKINRIPM